MASERPLRRICPVSRSNTSPIRTWYRIGRGWVRVFALLSAARKRPGNGPARSVSPAGRCSIGTPVAGSGARARVGWRSPLAALGATLPDRLDPTSRGRNRRRRGASHQYVDQKPEDDKQPECQLRAHPVNPDSRTGRGRSFPGREGPVSRFAARRERSAAAPCRS